MKLYCPFIETYCMEDRCALHIDGRCSIQYIAEALTEGIDKVMPGERIADALEKMAGIEIPEAK